MSEVTSFNINGQSVEIAGGGTGDSGLLLADDLSTADLNIGDSNGNVLVQFEDGHIKTKEFDSRNDSAQDDTSMMTYFNKVLCVGDSLTAGDFGSYPEGTANMHSPYCYPYYFEKLTNIPTTNVGRNGWTPINVWNSRESLIGTDGGYDCIYIYLGTNGGLTDTVGTDASGDDYTSYTTTTNTGAYCALIGWLQETYSSATIFLINFHYGRRGNSWSETNSAVLDKIATKFELHVIDIMNNSPFTSELANARLYRPVGIDDEIVATGNSTGNLHFGRLGYYELAKCIMRLTNEIISENGEEFAL